MVSAQTLSESDRRSAAGWAADCAARVLPLFESEAPEDGRVRDAIDRTRAYGCGELSTAGEIRRRFLAIRAAGSAASPAGAAAAMAAAQASAVAHMGAHALGAAAYSVKAAVLAAPEDPGVLREEIRWQLAAMTARTRAALGLLPPVGTHPNGPLGPGLLASGLLGAVIREIQADLHRQ